MNIDFEWLRNSVQHSIRQNRQTVAQAFREIIVQPPPPNPQEIWEQFISHPTEARQAEIQAIGPDEYQRKVDDMLALGEQLIGPRARDLMPYFEQDILLAQNLAETVPQGYPLLDQAMADTEGFDASTLYPQ